MIVHASKEKQLQQKCPTEVFNKLVMQASSRHEYVYEPCSELYMRLVSPAWLYRWNTTFPVTMHDLPVSPEI